MDERLFEAAQTGNVSFLHQLLNENPLVLHSVALASADTPLHVASVSGHLNFVKEIIRLKPEFAGELNQNGFGSIHLASANGYVEIVKELLMANRNHCRLKSKDVRTPIHYAAMKGRVDVINELISNCEESIEDVTIRCETALHLAVKNNQYEALKFMVERARKLKKEDILNKKDQEGNTILHLAITTKQREVVELLLGQDATSSVMKVNTLNHINLTALDVLLILPSEASDRDIEEILRRAGAKRGQEVQRLESLHDQVLENTNNNPPTSEVATTNSTLDDLVEFFKFQRGRDSPSDARDALLVLAVLIATATFQAGFSPPGGVWPAESSNTNSRYTAGIAVLGSKNKISFMSFLFFNSVGFHVSLFMIRVLTWGFPLRSELNICTWAIGFTYSTATAIISPDGLLVLILNIFFQLFIPIAIPFIRDWGLMLKEKKPWKYLTNRILPRRVQSSHVHP